MAAEPSEWTPVRNVRSVFRHRPGPRVDYSFQVQVLIPPAEYHPQHYRAHWPLVPRRREIRVFYSAPTPALTHGSAGWIQAHVNAGLQRRRQTRLATATVVTAPLTHWPLNLFKPQYASSGIGTYPFKKRHSQIVVRTAMHPDYGRGEY